MQHLHYVRIFFRQEPLLASIRSSLNGNIVQLCSGHLRKGGIIHEGMVTIPSGRAEDQEIESIWRRFADIGLQYGPMYRCISSLRTSRIYMLGNLKPRQNARAFHMLVHVADVDATFQLAVHNATNKGDPVDCACLVVCINLIVTRLLQIV